MWTIYDCVYHNFCILNFFFYSIWQRNLASTPCGLVICKPQLVSSSCLGVQYSEGNFKTMLTTQNRFSYVYVYRLV